MTCPARPAWPAYLGRHGQTRKTPACLPRPWRPILCALVLHHNITQPNPTPDGLLCRSRFTTAHNNGAGREKKPRKYPKIKQRPSLATAHFPSHTELPYSNGPAHFALLQAAEPRTVVLPIRYGNPTDSIRPGACFDGLASPPAPATQKLPLTALLLK